MCVKLLYIAIHTRWFMRKSVSKDIEFCWEMSAQMPPKEQGGAEEFVSTTAANAERITTWCSMSPLDFLDIENVLETKTISMFQEVLFV